MIWLGVFVYVAHNIHTIYYIYKFTGVELILSMAMLLFPLCPYCKDATHTSMLIVTRYLAS